jgi:hypothetical protein
MANPSIAYRVARWFFAPLALIAVTSLLSACGGDTGTASAPPAQSPPSPNS